MTRGMSLPGLNPPPSHLLQFPVGPNSQDPGQHPVWDEAIWAGLELGSATCFCSHSSLPPLLPLANPESPGQGE